MDARLKNVLDKVEQDKQNAKDAEAAEAAKRAEEHKAYINSQLPAAQEWVDKYLFHMIAKEEERGGSWKGLYLPASVGANDIPAEAIIEVANKIDGISALVKWEYPIEYDTGYSAPGSYSYIITWGEKSK